MDEHADGFLHDDSCRCCWQHRRGLLGAMRAPSNLPYALIGERHHEAYLRSAWFHATIDLLARFLPVLVDGLAAQAQEKAAEEQAQTERMQRSIPSARLPWLLVDE